ncbi:MAG: SGNH family hydrolase [Xanthobacteraceae bacterium]
MQFRDFFRFPFGDDRPRDRGFGNFSPYKPYTPPRPPQAVEATKPPPPRKVETQPTSVVLVIGDTFADWLAFGLEQTLADTPEIGIVRKIRPSSGLVRYDVRPDSPDWSQAVKDMLATEKPSAIVVMLGVNDRLPLRERAPSNKTSPQGQQTEKGPSANPPASNAAPAANAPQADSEQPAAAAPEPQRRPPGGNYEFRTDTWAELYEKRIDDMIAAVKSKGVPVFWVGLPAIRGAKSTSDMNYFDELYRARAEKAGIAYIDIWDGFVDEKGQFTMQGPDFEGQIRRLRTYDGVNFTNVGAEKLAHYVEHELRPALAAAVVPVALPGPEEQAPAKGNARPVVGPVVPLNAAAAAASGTQKGELLGATDHPAQHDSDSVATQVLSHGDAIAAPPGRADNFSWPRVDAGGAVDVASPPPLPKAPVGEGAPKEATPKDAASKNDAKKSAESKNQAGAGTASAKPRSTHQAPDSAQ